MKNKNKFYIFDYNHNLRDIKFDFQENLQFIYYNDLIFDKQNHYEKYIKQIEKIVRNSLEYKQWVKSKISVQICAITGISKLDSGDIELHHYPFTLYYIIQKIVEKFDKYYKNKKIQDILLEDDMEYLLNYVPTFFFAWEVIDLHLLDVIPFVPLLQSYHKLAHENQMEFSQDKIINHEKIPYLRQYLDGEISKQELVQFVKLNFRVDMVKSLGSYQMNRDELMKRTGRVKEKHLQYQNLFNISYQQEFNSEMSQLFKRIEQQLQNHQEIIQKIKINNETQNISSFKSVRIPMLRIKNQNLDLYGIKINYQQEIESQQTQLEFQINFYEITEQVILDYFMQWQHMILPIFSQRENWNVQNEYKQYLNVDLYTLIDNNLYPHFKFKFFGVVPYNIEKIILQQYDNSPLEVQVNFTFDYFKCYTYYYPNGIDPNQQNQTYELIEITNLG